MAVAQGYGKTVTSGSVFAYDTGDTVNSYLGEPTTNLAGTNAARTIGFHNQGAYGNAGSISDAPEKGPGWKKITVNNRGNNFRIAQFPYTSLTAGITYSYSLEIDMGTTSGYYWRIDGSGGYGAITIQNNKVVTTITPSAGVYAIFLNHNTTGVSGISEVIYYRYYQVEQNSHATQFTEGTRSATQGLLPLVGNSTIDLTNVSFDSNAQMTFDGTNDYISIPNTTSYSNFTVEVIVYPTSNPGNYASAISTEYPGSNSTVNFAIGWYAGSWFGGFYNNSSGGWHEVIVSAPTLNTYSHYVLTYNGAQVIFYKNGTSVGTLNTTDIAAGGNPIRIGRRWDTTDYFVGQIPVAKIYNLALTPAEVRQNYLHYKTRFNLS